MTTAHFHRTSRTGFTLVELLVVIGIIGVLAALLFPLLSMAQSRAMETKCTARLRSLGEAISLYAGDNNGAFVQDQNTAVTRWPLVLAPYVTPKLASEAAQFPNGSPYNGMIYQSGNFKDPLYDATTGGTAVFGYNMNLVEGTAVHFPVRMVSLTSPSTFPVLATSDTTGGIYLTSTGPTTRALKLGYSGPTSSDGPAPNYGQNALFLFADWHVQAINVCSAGAWPWNTPNAFKVQ